MSGRRTTATAGRKRLADGPRNELDLRYHSLHLFKMRSQIGADGLLKFGSFAYSV